MHDHLWNLFYISYDYGYLFVVVNDKAEIGDYYV